MAGSPPRRSSRARSTNNLSSHHSSTSSISSSGRSDRNTRAHTKSGSPTKSTLSDSLSLELQTDATVTTGIEDMLQTRHRKRGELDDRDKMIKSKTIEMSNESDEIGEDDEAVRCICGFDEYPGIPPPAEEDVKGRNRVTIEAEPTGDDDLSEDLAGFFLQCDTCKVWQHGGCVGIKNADMSPDEYFCEECRKDLHKIFTAPNGQRYSNYLPLHPDQSRTSSRAASFSKDGTRSPKSNKTGRASSATQSAKRRSTMNSRDAAYDEEEQMRRALEASMKDKGGSGSDTNLRRGKRGRSDSEEKPEASKRQRTVSNSPPPTQAQPNNSSNNDSDDGSNGRSSSKKIRGAAARNHKEKEAREEKERLRLEAANKRKGRADRRRGDESDPSDEAPLASRSVAKSAEPVIQQETTVSSQAQTPDTPPPNQLKEIVPQRKGGRPANTRRGKPGKNQYTKDRDEGDESPNRGQSRDNGREDGAHTRGHDSKSRAKGSLSSKITMQDMKKRVAAILAYISRIQIEMAGESQASSNNGDTEGTLRSVADLLPMIKVNGDGEAKDSVDSSDADQQKDFKDLSILEMMDYLTRELVKWQNQYI